MAPPRKDGSSAKDRRKSGNTTAKSTVVVTSRDSTPGKQSLVITFTVPRAKLQAIIDPESLAKKETTPSPEAKEAKESPASSTTLPTTAAANVNGENAFDSAPGTPTADGTPGPQIMGPPTEGPKKRGVKRSAAAANGEPKLRGKPGPKKRQKLDDGMQDSGRANGPAAPKLGPRANQGAINAGLRALDRSGKPCRRWDRGGFSLKSFTGTAWGVPRWTAPPKVSLAEGATDDSATASVDGGSSNKENKEVDNNSPLAAKSENNSNMGGGDVEMPHSTAPSVVEASSPAPIPIAAA